MRLRAVISGPAQRDAAEISSYYEAAAGPEIAGRVVRAISAAVSKLARSPGLGHAKPGLPWADCRFYLVRPHFIVYRVREERLEILRVIHAARDLAAILTANSAA